MVSKNLISLACFIAYSACANAGNPYAVDDAIYRIEIKNGNKLHTGTGVLVAPNTILTNCHVVRNSGEFKVINKRTGNSYPTQSYTNIGSLDACLLKGAFFEGRPVKVDRDIKEGDPVWTYGYPNRSPVIAQGLYVGLIDSDKGTVMQTTTYCHPGSSGGPLLNQNGNIVGLVFGAKTDFKVHCLAIPADGFMSRIDGK